MTVEEYKNKYPDKAHLEGDALCNAMEDCIPKTKPKPLADWMGNLVKDGDTVIVYRTRSMFQGDIFQCYMGSKEPAKKVGYIPNNFLWEEKSKYKIREQGNSLYAEIDIDGETWITDAFLIEFGKSSSDVICIEGVSDDKDKYINFKGGVYSERP